nr:YfiR family protein [Aromatoleum evansii]
MTHAQSADPTEHEVKAAFLYNFAKFVDWPPQAFTSADAPLALCVLGHDPFGAALSAVDGKAARSRTVQVRRLQHDGAVRDCHIVFLAAAETVRLRELVATLRGWPVLLVGESEDFATQGGIINLTVGRENRVQIEINLNAAQRHGLKISSQLLRLARIVGGE